MVSFFFVHFTNCRTASSCSFRSSCSLLPTCDRSIQPEERVRGEMRHRLRPAAQDGGGQEVEVGVDADHEEEMEERRKMIAIERAVAAVGGIHWHKQQQQQQEQQCTSRVVQRIKTPAGVVWSVLRRFDRPQAYKRFVRSCRLISGGNGAPFGVGAVREVRLVSGLPATRSTERLDLLDDRRLLLAISVVGGDHRLRNYRSITSLHPLTSSSCLAIESFVVDIPHGNTADETHTFVHTIIRTNLHSLALLCHSLAATEPQL